MIKSIFHKNVLLTKIHRGESKHADVIKWKHFPRYRSFVRRIYRSPVDSPLRDQWRGALIFSLIYFWTKGWVNKRNIGDLRRYLAYHDTIVMNWPKPDSFEYPPKCIYCSTFIMASIPKRITYDQSVPVGHKQANTFDNNSYYIQVVLCLGQSLLS